MINPEDIQELRSWPRADSSCRDPSGPSSRTRRTNRRAWIAQRALAYWEAGFRGQVEELDAVAALDLLRWRTGREDKAAVEGLP
jgi:hypothetical protein